MLNPSEASSEKAAPSRVVSPYQRFSKIQSLPDFVSMLKQGGLLCVEGLEGEGLVERSCDLYTMARFKDGVSCVIVILTVDPHQSKPH